MRGIVDRLIPERFRAIPTQPAPSLERDVFESNRKIAAASTVEDLGSLVSSTHPEIQRALIQRMIAEVKKPNPNLPLRDHLLSVSNPVVALECLKDILRAPEQTSDFHPKVIEALILAGAYYVPSANYLPSIELRFQPSMASAVGLAALTVGSLIPLGVYAYHSTSARTVLASTVWRDAHNNPSRSGVAAFLDAEVQHHTELADTSVEVLKHLLLGYPLLVLSLFRIARSSRVPETVGGPAIEFLLKDLMPALYQPIQKLDTSTLLEVLKKIPAGSDPKIKKLILDRLQAQVHFFMSTESKQSDLKELEAKIIASDNRDAIERLSFSRRSHPIAHKLREIAQRSSGFQQAELLFRGGDMSYLIGNVPDGLRTVLNSAEISLRCLSEAHLISDQDEREAAVKSTEQLLFICLATIASWTELDFANDPNELFRLIPGSGELWLKYLIKMEALSQGGEPQSLDDLRKLSERELEEKFGMPARIVDHVLKHV